MSDLLGNRMAELAREMLPARHPYVPTNEEPAYLVSYVRGSFAELGFYASAAVAKSASDIGKWFSLPDGGWRSEDGRTLVLTDAQFSAMRSAPARREVA